MTGTGTYVNGQPVMQLELDVRPEGLPAYSARKNMIVMSDEVEVGTEVPVFVDRGDPEHLVIDWGSM